MKVTTRAIRGFSLLNLALLAAPVSLAFVPSATATCTLNVAGGSCGPCDITGSPCPSCTINTGYCEESGTCVVNANGRCNADCFINAGVTFGGCDLRGQCMVNADGTCEGRCDVNIESYCYSGRACVVDIDNVCVGGSVAARWPQLTDLADRAFVVQLP